MRHNTHNITARCLYGLGMLTAACSVNSDAQETAAREALGPKAEPVIEEIVVTGSRLARTELTSTSPITVLGDEEIDSWGVSRIEGFIRATNINNGPAGGDGLRRQRRLRLRVRPPRRAPPALHRDTAERVRGTIAARRDNFRLRRLLWRRLRHAPARVSAPPVAGLAVAAQAERDLRLAPAGPRRSVQRPAKPG